MKKFIEEKTGSQITIWHEEKGVGLRFIEGETLQAYTADLVMNNPSEFCETEDGIKVLIKLREELTEYATEKYPKEFEPLKD